MSRRAVSATSQILVVLHRRDPYPRQQPHLIWLLAREWQARGHRVVVQRGARVSLAADLVFLHVDLTVIPAAYRALCAHYPRVVNRGLWDISKRAVSRNLLGPESAWRGPVIVKTDRNSAGVGEWWAQPAAMRLLRRLVGAVRPRSPLDAVLDGRYAVFPSLEQVLRTAFERRDLVVERFLGERAGDGWALRVCLFLGDRHRSLRLWSREPVIRRSSIERIDSVEVPAELFGRRRALGLDYGKIDYVLVGDRVELIDVNRTPGAPRYTDEAAGDAAVAGLAAGLDGLLQTPAEPSSNRAP